MDNLQTQSQTPEHTEPLDEVVLDLQVKANHETCLGRMTKEERHKILFENNR